MNAVLGIAIGVVFIVLVFSLVISGVNELLTAVFSLRSKVLWTTLCHFSSSETDRTTKLDASSLLAMFKPVGGKDPRPRLGSAKVAGPAAGASTQARFVASIVRQTARFETGSRKSRLKHVAPSTISRAVLELGGDVSTLVGASQAQIAAYVTQLRNAVAGTQLEAPVAAAIAAAEGDVQNFVRRFRTEIEDWFDSRMAVLSSLYKTWARWILLVLSLVLAFTVDVNPIVSIDLLRKDAALSQATVDQAVTFLKNEGLSVPKCPVAPTTTAAAQPAAAAPETTTTVASTTAVADCYTSVRDAIARTRTLPPPLSFEHFGPGNEAGWQYLLGCLLGGIAISFGAPFWFDVLRKLVAQRT